MIFVSHHSHIEVSMAVADGLAHVCNNHGEVARPLYIRSIQRNDHNLGGFPFGSNCRSPRWEVEGSKGNSAIRGNCGNIAERWQVGNNRWKVGNNRMWRHRDLAYFSQFPPVNITQMYLTCWFWFNYWSSWENNMSTFIFNQFSLRLWKTALRCLFRLFNGPVVTISSGVLYINTQKYLGPVEQTMCVPRIQLPSYYAITETFER